MEFNHEIIWTFRTKTNVVFDTRVVDPVGDDPDPHATLEKNHISVQKNTLKNYNNTQLRKFNNY